MSKVGFQDHRQLDCQGLNGARITVKSSKVFTSTKRTVTSSLPKGSLSLEDGMIKIVLTNAFGELTDEEFAQMRSSIKDTSFKTMHPAKKRKLARTMRRENVRMGLKR
jgi:hypothetical protein